MKEAEGGEEEVEVREEAVFVRGIEGECLREAGVLSWVGREEAEAEREGEREGVSDGDEIVGSDDRFGKNELAPFLGGGISSALPDLVFLRRPFCGATFPEESMYQRSIFSPKSASESATYTSPKNLCPTTASQS
jgi:hypothetical protein